MYTYPQNVVFQQTNKNKQKNIFLHQHNYPTFMGDTFTISTLLHDISYLPYLMGYFTYVNWLFTSLETAIFKVVSYVS